MRHFILLLSLMCGTVQAEGLYLTLGAGENSQLFSSNDDWDDADGMGAYIAATYQWDQQSWCFGCRPSINYVHLSQWDKGAPFTDDFEDSVDHLGFAGTWTIWEK